MSSGFRGLAMFCEMVGMKAPSLSIGRMRWTIPAREGGRESERARERESKRERERERERARGRERERKRERESACARER